MLDQFGKLPHLTRDGLATVALATASVLASLTYTQKFLWLFTRERSYAPDLVSGITAVLLLLPLMRGRFLLNERLTWHSALNLALLFYLTAAFANIGLGGSSWLKAPTGIVTIIVVLVANLNPRKFGELAAIVLAVFGGFNLLSANGFLGFNGFLLAFFSFVAVLLMIDLQKVLSAFKHS